MVYVPAGCVYLPQICQEKQVPAIQLITISQGERVFIDSEDIIKKLPGSLTILGKGTMVVGVEPLHRGDTLTVVARQKNVRCTAKAKVLSVVPVVKVRILPTSQVVKVEWSNGEWEVAD